MPLKRTKRYDQALPLLYISDHDIAAISSQWFDIAAHQDRYSFGLAICEFGLSNATYLDVGIISSVCLFVCFCFLYVRAVHELYDFVLRYDQGRFALSSQLAPQTRSMLIQRCRSKVPVGLQYQQQD